MKASFILLLCFEWFLGCQSAHLDRSLCKTIGRFGDSVYTRLPESVAKLICGSETNSLENGHSATNMNMKQSDWLGNLMDKLQERNHLLSSSDNQADGTKQWNMRSKRAVQSVKASDSKMSKTEEEGSETFSNTEEGNAVPVSKTEESVSEHSGGEHVNTAPVSLTLKIGLQHLAPPKRRAKHILVHETVPPMLKAKQISVQEPVPPMLKAKQLSVHKPAPLTLKAKLTSAHDHSKGTDQNHVTTDIRVTQEEVGENTLSPSPLQDQKVKQEKKKPKTDKTSFTTMTVSLPMNLEDARKALSVLEGILKSRGIAHKNKDTAVKHQAVGGFFTIKERRF